MEFFDTEHDLFVSIVAFYCPAAEVEFNNLFFGESAFIEQVSEQDGDSAIGAFQPNDSELDEFGLSALFGARVAQVIARRGDEDAIVVFAFSDGCLDGGKSGLGRAAEKKVASVLLSQCFDEGVTGKPSIKEQHTIGRNMRQEALSLIALGVMDTPDNSGYGQLSEDIVGGHNEALREVAFAVMIETAFRIELGADLHRCWKSKLGAVHGVYGHLVPEVRRIARPEAVGHRHSPVQDVLKDGPRDLFSCSGNVAAVGSVGIMPKTTAPGAIEKLQRFDTHAFALPACHKGEYKNDQPGEGELALAGEMGVR